MKAKTLERNKDVMREYSNLRAQGLTAIQCQRTLSERLGLNFGTVRLILYDKHYPDRYNVQGTKIRRRRGKHHNLKHGMCNTPTYRIWIGMTQRCTNQNLFSYRYYGARGIKVCKKWRNFAAFFADMGERPVGKTIDRINNDRDYEPGNCRWATPKEQANNQRRRKRNL